jgi:hypothetical protein
MNKILVLVSCLVFVVIEDAAAQNANFAKYWEAERTYFYEAILTDSSGTILSEETIIIHPTEKVWEIDDKQTLIDIEINYQPDDSTRLNSSPFPVRSKSWSRNYQEGVIENSKRVWMHPIRVNQYILTEIAPFPEIRLPPLEGFTWDSWLEIYQFDGLEGRVSTSYVIEDLEERTYDFSTMLCWKVVASGKHDKFGESTLVLYFNDLYGFTEMHYLFYNGQKVSFTLTDFKYQPDGTGF